MSRADDRVGIDMPRVTEHAAIRWDERTAPDSVAPETAWRSSQRITAVEVACRADEARFHGATETLLVERNRRIVTVLSRPFREDLHHHIEHLIDQ